MNECDFDGIGVCVCVRARDYRIHSASIEAYTQQTSCNCHENCVYGFCTSHVLDVVASTASRLCLLVVSLFFTCISAVCLNPLQPNQTKAKKK